MKRVALRSKPAQTREWQERSRKKAREAASARLRAVPTRTRPKARPTPSVPAAARREARARSKGKCIVCVWRGAIRPRKAVHLHHALPKQSNKWPELAAEADNLVGCCEECHWAHEYGPARKHRIPLEALPQCVFELAARTSHAAVDYLLRKYPSGADAGGTGS